MYSDSDLDAAVAAGALAPEAAETFRAYVARARETPAVDEEHFRLLTGFNDIFVTIAVLLILLPIGRLEMYTEPLLSSAGVAAASWALAEFFTRKRRMALPSIFLLAGFAAGIAGLTFSLLSTWSLFPPTAWSDVKWKLAITAAVTTLAVYGHWRRFKVPITVALGVGSLLATCYFMLFIGVPTLRQHSPGIIFIGGLCVFAIAMWWDASDPARQTRRSDVAFWLHLMAAPLLVHPIFAMLGLLGSAGVDTVHATAAIGVYLILGIVALAIDRRALLVSALAYVLTAMTALFRAAGSASVSFALTALIIGSALLLLSAFWHPTRRILMSVFPVTVRRRLPGI